MRCSLALAAAVLLVSSCASRPRVASAMPPKFNLSGEYDVNGFSLNPSWLDAEAASLAVSPHPICDKPPLAPACNDQSLPGSGVDSAERNFWRALFRKQLFYQTCEKAAHEGFFPGHVNLGVATFEGSAAWTGLSFDGDYDFLLRPRNGGVTKASTECIGLEFSADETFHQFDCLTPWWRQYADMAVQRRANELLIRDNNGNPPFAIVTGLLGFDCEHGCVTELHPVYVMAIRRSGGAREEWAFFVRNWGSEGWCSRQNHMIQTTRLRLLLPYPGAQNGNALMEVQSSFQVYASRGRGFLARIGSIFRANRPYSPAVDVVAVEGGVLVTFELPPPESRPVVEGELSFRWREAVALTNFDGTPCSPAASAASAEEAFERLRRALPIEKTMFVSATPQRLTQPTRALAATVRQTKESRVTLAPPLSISASASFDSAKQTRDRRTMDAIRQLCMALAAEPAITQNEDYQLLCAPEKKP